MRRSHAAKRQSILNAAAAVFCREGLAGANIDLIAAEAGVSRQTVYNHHGDKEKLFDAVLRQVTDRCNARAYAVLDTFPDQPTDLERELTDFALRMNKNCLCCQDGEFLNKLIQLEGERHPELFDVWREEGPGKIASALAARFARLAYSGYLDIDDPDVAARHFMALNHADIHLPTAFGRQLSDEQLLASTKCAVHTFLRAFGRKTIRTPETETMQG